MQVNDFRLKIKPGAKLVVNTQTFDIKEVVKFRFDNGDFYIKCYLSDDYVFADDLNENMFLLVKEIGERFPEPFPKELEFRGEKFSFLYNAHAVAEEVFGEEVFKRGDSEKFWDYKAQNGNGYLSLGINDTTGEQVNFFGEIVKTNSVDVIS